MTMLPSTPLHINTQKKAPTQVKPDDNVIVRLCTIECCFAHTLNDISCSENASLMQDLSDWGKICWRYLKVNNYLSLKETDALCDDLASFGVSMMHEGDNAAADAFKSKILLRALENYFNPLYNSGNTLTITAAYTFLGIFAIILQGISLKNIIKEKSLLK